MFHFNKGCIANPEIPMWTLKFDGETQYAHHIDFENVSFSTKETPDNPSTKGSLKFKNILLTLATVDGIISAVVTHNNTKES